MRGEAVAGLEPADVLAVPVAGQHAEIDRQRGVPAEVRQARTQALLARDDRHDVEQGVVLGHAEVVHHAVVGDLEPRLPHDLALRVDLVIGHVAGQQALRRIAEADHVAAHRVELGVGGEGLALYLAVEVPVAMGLQRDGVHGDGRAVLLQRPQLAAVDDGVGVGGAADPAADGGVIVDRVTVVAEQGLAGLVLQLPLVGPDPAVLEIDPPLMEAERGDHPVAVEPDVVAHARGELRIGVHPEEGAVDVLRDLAVHIQVGQVDLIAGRGHEALEVRGAGEMDHLSLLSLRSPSDRTRARLDRGQRKPKHGRFWGRSPDCRDRQSEGAADPRPLRDR